MKFPFKNHLYFIFSFFLEIYTLETLYRYLKFNVQGWKRSIHKTKDNHNIYNVSLIEEYICHMSISIRFAYHTDIRVFDLINEKKM